MIRLDTVTKEFEVPDGDPVVAVDRVSFEVAEGETLCLIGTSGSGKTTCMKMINRLLEPTSGTVMVGGEDIQSLDPIVLRRSIGYVIQKGGLMPHMTVGDNIGLLPKLEKWETGRRRERVRELLELVNLDPDQYVSRYPGELSGGQQQRVGVARALALDPKVILMDEPFGALDPITREGLHEEFLRLAGEVKKTIVIVTHDLAEAFKLGHRIALMDQGKLVQVGTRDDLLKRPANDFAEEFVRSHAANVKVLVRELASPVAGEDRDLPTVSGDTTARKALRRMLEEDLKTLKVVDDQGESLGLVTDRELLECL